MTTNHHRCESCYNCKKIKKITICIFVDFLNQQ